MQNFPVLSWHEFQFFYENSRSMYLQKGSITDVCKVHYGKKNLWKNL